MNETRTNCCVNENVQEVLRAWVRARDMADERRDEDIRSMHDHLTEHLLRHIKHPAHEI